MSAQARRDRRQAAFFLLSSLAAFGACGDGEEIGHGAAGSSGLGGQGGTGGEGGQAGVAADADAQVDTDAGDAVCVAGSKVNCYTGPIGTKDVGACHAGSRTCASNGSGYGPCAGEVTPSPETCLTPFDDDCDGKANEEGTGCVCKPGDTLECYTGPAGTVGIGACHTGAQTCNGGLGFGACVNAVIPTTETCGNFVDDDCDGLVDELCGLDCLRSAGGLGADAAFALAALADGTAYLTGSFQNTATFGAGEAGQTVLNAVGKFEMFVARYGPDCKLTWGRGTKSATAVDSAAGRAIAAVPSGGVIVASGVSGTTTFGPGETKEQKVTGAQLAVTKYSDLGALQWVGTVPVSGAAALLGAADVAVRSDGTSYVVGLFRGTATFGPGEPNETVLVSNSRRIFVARYDATGGLLWARRAGSDYLGPSDLPGNMALAADVGANGDLLVSGSFIGTATFGEQEINETTFVSTAGQDLQCIPAPTADIFVARYHPDGKLAWAKRAGGKGNYDIAFDLAATPDGGAFVVGSCGLDWCDDPLLGPATFGPGESLQTALPCSFRGDMFVARYAKDGSLVWVRRAASAAKSSLAADVGILPDGSLVLAGFSSGLTFAPAEANETALSDTGRFLARYDDNGAFQWVKLVGPPQLDFRLRVGAGGTLAMAGTYFGTTKFFPSEPSSASLVSAGANDVWLARFAP